MVLGILGAVAFPKFAPIMEDAYIAKAQAKVDTVRSGLQNYRSKNLLKGRGGDFPYPLDQNETSLFCKVAKCERAGTGSGQWERVSTDDDQKETLYLFHTGSSDIKFKYSASTGTFECISPEDLCKRFE